MEGVAFNRVTIVYRDRVGGRDLLRYQSDFIRVIEIIAINTVTRLDRT